MRKQKAEELTKKYGKYYEKEGRKLHVTRHYNPTAASRKIRVKEGKVIHPPDEHCILCTQPDRVVGVWTDEKDFESMSKMQQEEQEKAGWW